MQKTVYAKSSMDRKSEYRLITRIYEEDGIRKVEKIAQNGSAAAHVERMAQIASDLVYATENVRLVPCKKVAEGCVISPYIVGQRLDELIAEYTKKHQWEKVYENIKFWQKLILNVDAKHPFQACTEFEQIFGTHPELEGFEAAANLNIDMSASNIIMAEYTYIVDYEWTFNFDIPLKYIVYRSILCSENIAMLPVDVKKKVEDSLNISEKEKKIFDQMEVSFRQYIAGLSLGGLYEKMPVINYRIEAGSAQNVLSFEQVTPCGEKISTETEQQKSDSERELELIKNSRSWKMIMFLKRLLKR